MTKTITKATRNTGFDAGAAMLREQIKTLPKSSGVYRMIGDNGTPLYVGKAKNLKNRVASYTQRARLPTRLQRMVSQAKSLEITVTRSEAEALLLEASFIQKFAPPFNILLRDDKSYPYILITRDRDFPQLMKHRGAQSRKGWYFGPFASGGAVTETLNLLQRAFMLRSCHDGVFANRSRPCLQYHIKRCTAPCVGLVGQPEYASQVEDAVDFLKGRNKDLQSRLSLQMQEASDDLNFEKAAMIRDRIKMLSDIQARQSVHLSNVDDADVIAMHQGGGKTAVQIFFFRQGRNYGARVFQPSHAREQQPQEILSAFIAQFYADKPAPSLIIVDRLPSDCQLIEEALSQNSERRVKIFSPKSGDKKRLVDMAAKNAQEYLAREMAERNQQSKLLELVSSVFGMEHAPKRIEVYDNSHTAGTYAVGAMIAAGVDGFLKKTYRKFNIRTAQGNDDFGMMREVFTRRFSRLMTEDPDRKSDLWPDLVIIDGGAGQLSKAAQVLKELGVEKITVVGIAKGPDRNAGRERFFLPDREPFDLPHDDPVLYYLQRLRDEAHRFAIGTHRARREKAIGKSRLDDIAGIGVKRKKALLHHFGSAQAVEEADLDQLARTPGINKATAKRIWEYFQK